MESPLRNLPDAILFLNSDNQIIGINPAGENLLKVTQTDLIGKSVDTVFPRRESSVYRKEILADGLEEASLSLSDGQTLYAELTISTINGLDGKYLGQIVIIRESARSYQHEMNLKQEESLQTQNLILRALQETTYDLHSSLDLKIVFQNIVERACQLLKTPHGYLDILVDEEDELVPMVSTGILEDTLGERVKRGDGISGTVWETGEPLVIPNYDQWSGRSVGFRYGVIRAIVGMPLFLKDKVVGVLGVAHGFDNELEFSEEDVSILKRFADLAVIALQNAQLFEKAQAEIEFRRNTEIKLRNANQLLQWQIERVEMLQEQLQDLAVRDPLTGLYNRRYLQEALELEFAYPNRSEKPMAILMLDSDHLKDINDKYGHKAGDDFLVHIAKVTRKRIRAGDIACRYGGDEFVVLLDNVTENIAVERAEKLRKNIASHHIVHRNEKVSISVSIGIAMFPAHGLSGEVLLQKADQALYNAKRMGKNRVWVYQENQQIT